MTTLDDIKRDMREQKAAQRYEDWLGSEEYRNSVQLKYEALLCDGDLLNEAIGADGIQYPFSRIGLWEDVRRRRREYENNVYYPWVAKAVMREDATSLGKLLLRQIKNYIWDIAEKQIREGYDGQ